LPDGFLECWIRTGRQNTGIIGIGIGIGVDAMDSRLFSIPIPIAIPTTGIPGHNFPQGGLGWKATPLAQPAIPTKEDVLTHDPHQ